MKTLIKTQLQIDNIRRSCHLLAQMMSDLTPMVVAGVTPLDIDKYAYEWISSHDAKPAFLGYGKFPNTLCIGVNDMSTHGVPTDRPFANEDIVTIDAGLIFNNMYSDMARTFLIGEVASEKVQFVHRVEDAWRKAKSQALPGNSVGDISYQIHSNLKPYGYSPLIEYVGHGIGAQLHEEPAIPGAYGKAGEGILLRPGMVLAIESLVNMGGPKVIVSKTDRWTTHTADGSMFSLFEDTVLITLDGQEILTKI